LHQLDVQIDAAKVDPIVASSAKKKLTPSSQNPQEVQKSIKTKKKSIIETNKTEKPIATEQDPYKAYLDKNTSPDEQINIMKQWMKDHDISEAQIDTIKPTTWKAILDLHNDPAYP